MCLKEPIKVDPLIIDICNRISAHYQPQRTCRGVVGPLVKDSVRTAGDGIVDETNIGGGGSRNDDIPAIAAGAVGNG